MLVGDGGATREIPLTQERSVRVDSSLFESLYIEPQGRGFIGGQLVKRVGSWDGVGYPVETLSNTISFRLPQAIETYYDFELSCLHQEVPNHFWWHKENQSRYKNVHEWVRQQRSQRGSK